MSFLLSGWTCGLLAKLSILLGGCSGVWVFSPEGVDGLFIGGWGDKVGIVWSPDGTEAGWECGLGKGEGATDGGVPTDGIAIDSCVRGYDGGPPWGV